MSLYYNPGIGNSYSPFTSPSFSGQYNWQNYSGSFNPSNLLEAANTASNTGDTKWKKVVDLVLGYGEKVLSILTKTGILKNKNATSDDLLKAIVAGDINRALSNSVYEDAEKQASRSADLLGIPTSYWIIGLVGVLVYLLFRQQPTTSKKK